mgnify:FL=1|uniref:AAA+ ATPase domain-containing protein n=1 Tax=viral metagenome TaxID=1070528 RepID=A0A6C0J3K4_9ZZZZ
MQNIFSKVHHENLDTYNIKKNLDIHKNIYEKLKKFEMTNKIPHLIFHGASGTGKRTIVNKFLNSIYNSDKQRMKTNIMIVNCAHGKGIKFIREELKFFAKTNINSNNGKLFKTIVLINADNLTIDAQSALRRCIEQFSFNTRFFIIIENKHKLLNPILSRFCEIYVPEYIVNSEVVNLHKLARTTNYKIEYNENHQEWITDKIDEYIHEEINHINIIKLCEDIYEKGLSSLDIIEWIQQTETLDNYVKSQVCMGFDIVRKEYRFEKLLMMYIFDFLYLRTNKDLKSITKI